MALFSSFQLFLFNEANDFSLPDLQAGYEASPAREATGLELEHGGWGEVDSGMPVVSVNNLHLMMFVEHKRVLPPVVIKKSMDAGINAFKDKNGRNPKAAEKTELKDNVLRTLLPKSFQKQSRTPVLFDPKSNRIFIGTPSLSSVSDIAVRIVKDMKIKLIPLQNAPSELSKKMTGWVTGNESDLFQIGRSCGMESMLDSRSKVKLSAFDLESKQCIAHIQDGYMVSDIEIILKNDVAAIVTKELVFKSVKSGADDSDADGDEVSTLAADMIVFANNAKDLEKAVMHD